MGIVKLPSVTMYWSNSFIASGPKCFTPEVMSRNRFLSMLKFLRFSDPDRVRKNAPLTRLEPYLSFLRENCMTLVDPGRSIAVDETLLLWKGRLHFRIYIKTKRSRFGIKLYCACPSSPELRGYTWNFQVAVGKDRYHLPHLPDSATLSVSERIVVFLIDHLLDQGRLIIVDNWYMSVRLAEFLLNYRTLIMGTIRRNRGVPELLEKETLQKYQSCFVRRADMLIVRWQDKKDVFVLSTQHTASFIEKSRYIVGGRQLHFNKPLHIEEYNLLMGGVDACDQDLEPYNPCRKTLAWFKKLGIHMASRMLLNSKVFYEHAHHRTVPYLDYLLLTCEGLLEKYSMGYACMKNSTVAKVPVAVMNAVHCWVPITPTATKKRPQKKCHICSQEKIRKDCRKVCSGCPDKPGLCSLEHFEAWHKQRY